MRMEDSSGDSGDRMREESGRMIDGRGMLECNDLRAEEREVCTPLSPSFSSSSLAIPFVSRRSCQESILASPSLHHPHPFRTAKSNPPFCNPAFC